MNSDSTFMKRAIRLAMQGLGRTAPNPPVGAVLVNNSEIVGEGFHPKAGLPHAEVYAIRCAGDKAKGATLYVTLEPCSHYGRTPPCAEGIIAAGIKRVVVGAIDPNPLVSGKGIEMLRNEGIEVVVGQEKEEAGKLITWYETWMEKKRPYVIVKAATTLDGKIATTNGDSKWISSEESRYFVHQLRNQVDGILIGIGTVLMDNPQLTCRIEGGRDPLRIIIDKDLVIPGSAHVLGKECLIITAKSPQERPELTKTGSQVIQIAHDDTGEFAWPDILKYLGESGLHAVMVEGGSSIISSILKSRLVDKIILSIAPKLLGGGIPLVNWGSPERIADAYNLVITGHRITGGDVLIEASLKD